MNKRKKEKQFSQMNHLAVNRHKITYWLIWFLLISQSVNHWISQPPTQSLPCLHADQLGWRWPGTPCWNCHCSWNWSASLTLTNEPDTEKCCSVDNSPPLAKSFLFFNLQTVWFQNSLLIIMPQCVPHIWFSCSFSKFCVKSFAGVWYFEIVCDGFLLHIW